MASKPARRRTARGSCRRPQHRGAVTSGEETRSAAQATLAARRGDVAALSWALRPDAAGSAVESPIDSAEVGPVECAQLGSLGDAMPPQRRRVLAPAASRENSRRCAGGAVAFEHRSTCRPRRLPGELSGITVEEGTRAGRAGWRATRPGCERDGTGGRRRSAQTVTAAALAAAPAGTGTGTGAMVLERTASQMAAQCRRGTVRESDRLARTASSRPGGVSRTLLARCGAPGMSPRGHTGRTLARFRCRHPLMKSRAGPASGGPALVCPEAHQARRCNSPAERSRCSPAPSRERRRPAHRRRARSRLRTWPANSAV